MRIALIAAWRVGWGGVEVGLALGGDLRPARRSLGVASAEVVKALVGARKGHKRASLLTLVVHGHKALHCCPTDASDAAIRVLIYVPPAAHCAPSLADLVRPEGTAAVERGKKFMCACEQGAPADQAHSNHTC